MLKLFFTIMCFLSLAISPANAEHYRYKIVVLNMPIGEATVDLDRSQSDYKLIMTTKFSGIVALFTGADAKVESIGKIISDTARPTHTDGRIKWGKKLRIALIDFDKDGNVTNLDVKPKYSYPKKERHDLDHATLKNVQDPLSAMYRPLKDGAIDCTVRIQAFDSKERYDLQFTPTESPMTCNVQPIPVSGYKKSYDDKGNEPKPLLITFTPTADGTHAIPSRIERDMLLGWLELDLI